MNKQTNIDFIDLVHSIISNFIDENYGDIKSISSVLGPDTLRKEIDFTLGKKHSLDQMKEFIHQYLDYSVKTGNIHFYNQLFSGFSTLGYTGDAIVAATNASMYTYEMSPVATLMENELIKKMCQLIGYDNGGGTFVTGGSNGNFLALLAARHKQNPDSKIEGLFNQRRLVGFVSKDSHYSMLKAANQSGIGLNNIIQIPVDSDGKMRLDYLESNIEKVKKKDDIPFFVAATAGTTVRGAFDSINEIGDLCKAHNIWFHIDGSWGGAVLFSSKHQSLISGLEKSDSFTWCAHKILGVPIICSMTVVKDRSILETINQVSGTDYLFHDNGHMDLGQLSLQCGRRVDVLKLWLIWKYYGDSDLEKQIDRLFDLASYAKKKVVDSPILALIPPVEFLNICFQIKPKNIPDKNLNSFNILVRNQLIKEKGIMVNYANIGENTCIRLITTNLDLQKTHIDLFFESLHAVVDELSS